MTLTESCTAGRHASTGRVSHTDIDGARSDFHARPAWVYLHRPTSAHAARYSRCSCSSPASPAVRRTGSSPGKWPNHGRLRGRARRSRPIVVVADATGASLANTLCLDSRLGRVETYLAEDVPAWIERTLQVDRDHAHWAIGGFSFGGTCALQLAVRRPATYPTFLDISGQQEPTLGSHAKTVQAAFGATKPSSAR